ncbi:MAG: hypothetical protein DDT21_01872 [Syntrophomonadaceae bacterium]|nr:hypothetical protein [Bacillota bacterium]
MNQVAATIYRQMGGNRFCMMTGADRFTKTDNSLAFRIPKARVGINSVKVTLTQADEYDMEFGRIRAGTYTIVSTQEGVCFDMLQELFTAETGLAFRL